MLPSYSFHLRYHSSLVGVTVLRAACQAIPDIWFVLESDDRQRPRLCLFGWNQYCRTYQPHQPEVESAMMVAQALFFVVLQRCIRIRLIAALSRPTASGVRHF